MDRTDRGVTPTPLVPGGPAPRVQILRWPADQHRRQSLSDGGQGCLWLLACGELAPVMGPGEDWIRVPADERDISARVQRLARRGPRSGSLRSGDLHADADGVVSRGSSRVILTPREAAIFGLLAERPGRLVTRQRIHDEVWAGAAISPRSLDGRVRGLRAKLAGLDLLVHTIRSRGYVLDRAPGSGEVRA